jgi:hypothetical protein
MPVFLAVRRLYIREVLNGLHVAVLPSIADNTKYALWDKKKGRALGKSKPLPILQA